MEEDESGRSSVSASDMVEVVAGTDCQSSGSEVRGAIEWHSELVSGGVVVLKINSY